MKKVLAFMATAALLAACQKTETPAITADGSVGNVDQAAPAALPAPVGVAAEASVPAWASASVVDDKLKCYLDLMNNEGGAGEGKPHRQLKIGTPADLSGWAIDPAKSGDQSAAYVVFNPQQGGDSYYYRANRNERPDVAAAPEFASIKPTKAGVTVVAATNGMKPGLYQIEYVIGGEAAARRCSVGAPWVVSLVQ